MLNEVEASVWHLAEARGEARGNQSGEVRCFRRTLQRQLENRLGPLPATSNK